MSVSPSRLRFSDLVHAYGPHVVLRQVSGQVESGELLMVEGSNGTGKSTLIRCLAGLQRPRSGTIELIEQGYPLDVGERRLRVGWVGPDLSFYSALTAAENLEFFGRLRGVQPASGRDLLRRLSVPAQRPAGALSSGMLQRLRWVFALQHQPSLLLLDEPFQNLDDAGESDSRALLGEHLERGGLAVVASPVSLGLDPARRITLDSGAVDSHGARP